MSKLIEVGIKDIKDDTLFAGLTEETFHDQITTNKYPAIYVESGAIELVTLKDGILTLDETSINLFSGTVLQVVEAINAANGVARITTAKLGLCPALALDNLESSEYMNIKIDKSPLYLPDFHTRAISNIIDLSPTNVAYEVQSVFDDAGKDIPYTLTSTNNLYVEKLGTAIVKYSIKNFVLFVNEDKLLSTKALIKYAKENAINPFEKSILLDQYLKSFDMIYA